MIGKVRITNQAEARFWVRVFRLEKWTDLAQARIASGSHGDYASVPVVHEFSVGGELMFYIFLVLRIDSLGLCDGYGLIWIVSGVADRPRANKERDELADDVLSQLSKEKPFDEAFSIEPEHE